MASSIASSPVVVRCKGILFDMDGILISSLGSVERSWTKWASMRGVDVTYVLSFIHGRRAIESVALLRPDLDPVEELKLNVWPLVSVEVKTATWEMYPLNRNLLACVWP